MATAFLPYTWARTDEEYNLKNINLYIKILATLDESSYSGGTNGPNHPIAWYHTFEGGKSFYTAGGHTSESFSEPLFLRHRLGDIKYAIGKGLLRLINISSAAKTDSEKEEKNIFIPNGAALRGSGHNPFY